MSASNQYKLHDVFLVKVKYRIEWGEETITGTIFKRRVKIGGTVGREEGLIIAADSAEDAMKIAINVVASYKNQTGDIEIIDVHKESMRVYA
jgi:hypothetical protein